MFSYILPFVGFIVDASIKRAFLISASIPYITLKVVLILCYLVAYVLAIQKVDDQSFFYLMIVAQIVFPILMIIYTVLLLKNKLM